MADNPIDIQALARGDEKAFQALFVEYYPALVSFRCRYVVSKETAEDIVQDVFVRIGKPENRSRRLKTSPPTFTKWSASDASTTSATQNTLGRTPRLRREHAH